MFINKAKLFPISDQEMDFIIYTSLHVSGKFYLAILTILPENVLKQRIVWTDILTGDRRVNLIEP